MDVLRNLRNSSTHPQTSAILAAVTAVIQERTPVGPGEFHAPIAYFAALMSTLDVKKELDSSTAASLMQIMATIFPRIPPTVISAKFDEIATVFSFHLEKHTHEALLVKSICICISIMLLCINPQWIAKSNTSVMRMLQALLVFSVDNRAKIRKIAQMGVRDLYSSLETGPLPIALPESTVRFCQHEINKSTNKDVQVVLYLCGLLQMIILKMPISSVASVLSLLLQLSSNVNSPILLVQVLQTVDIMLTVDFDIDIQDEKKKEKHMNLVEKIVILLNKLVPHSSDELSAVTHFKSLSNGYSCLLKNKPYAGIALFPMLPEILSNGILSQKSTVADACCACVEVVAPFCFTNETMKHYNNNNDNNGKLPYEIVIQTLQDWLSYSYKPSWGKIFNIIGRVISVIPSPDPELFRQLISTVVKLRSINDSKSFNYLEAAVGQAISVFGPEYVLRIAQFQLPTATSTESSDIQESLKKSGNWLLPILKQYTKPGQGSFALFRLHFLPSSTELFDLSALLLSNDDGITAKLLEATVIAIWEVFPAFCVLTNDTQSEFKKIAKSLGELLQDPQQICAHQNICNGLNNLIQSNLKIIKKNDNDDDDNDNDDNDNDKKMIITKEEAENNIKVIGKFGKNFLPLLFNLLCKTEPGRRKPVLNAIQSYSIITDELTCNSLFQQLLQEAITNKGSEELDALLDIMFALSKQLTGDNITLLFRGFMPLLCGKPLVQKKSYRLLAEIISSHRIYLENHWNDITSLLSEASASLVTVAIPTRLMCLRSILIAIPELYTTHPHVLGESMQIFLGEVILSVKEHAAKSRLLAYDVLVDMGKGMKKVSSNTNPVTKVIEYPLLSEYLSMLLAGVAANTARMQSAAILSLSRVIYEFQKDISQETITGLLTVIIPLFQKRAREVVKSVLAFVKVISLSLQEHILFTHLKPMVEGLTLWARDPKERNKQRVKQIFEILVRRLGPEVILPLVPVTHVKLIEYITKQLDRKRVKKLEKQRINKDNKNNNQHNNMDHREDFDDIFYGSDDDNNMNNNDKKVKDGSVWIRDGNVNLLDDTAMKHIVTSKPKNRNKNKNNDDDFKIGMDGRMIIAEDDTDGDHDDDDSDDYDDDDEVLGYKTTRKNKNSSSVKMVDSDSDDIPEENRVKPEELPKQKKKRKQYDDDVIDDNKENSIQKTFNKKTRQANRRGDVTGSHYAASKAGGDVKKGKLDPFAFYALDPSELNRRNRTKAQARFKNVVNPKESRPVGNKMSKNVRMARKKHRAMERASKEQ